MSQPKKDDWLKVRRTIAEADAIKRNKKIRAVKDIGKTVINRYRLPLCKINKDGSSYKLDENGNKIPVVHTRKGKKRVVTRKAVSFKDLTSYYLMAPKIAYIKDIPVSVIKAVQAVGLIKLHHSLLNKPYDLDKIIKNEQQAVNDLSNPQQKDQASNKSDSKDENKQIAENVAHQTDQNHTSTDNNDSDNDQQPNMNRDQDKKTTDNNDTLNTSDPNNLGDPSNPNFKNM